MKLYVFIIHQSGLYQPPESLSTTMLQEAQPKLSVIMPAFNEQDHIQDSIERIMDVVRGLELEFEIIVVDDGSRDLTRAVATNGLKDNSLKVIGYDKNMGKGYAINNGFAHSIGVSVVILVIAGILFSRRRIRSETESVVVEGWDLGYFLNEAPARKNYANLQEVMIDIEAWAERQCWRSITGSPS